MIATQASLAPVAPPTCNGRRRQSRIDGNRPKVPPSCAEVGLADARVMIVDDVAINAKVLKAQLAEAGFQNLETVIDATEAYQAIQTHQPDILLLDIMMPVISGLDLLEMIRFDQELERLPVLILTSAESRELKKKALELGATDFLPKPVDVEELVPRVRNTLLAKRYQDDLEQRVRERTKELERAHEELVHCLARAAEFRDNDTGMHVVRVGRMVGIIAHQMDLPPDRVRMLSLASTLHDVGKIGIPDAILLKEGKLTPEEMELMQRHCGFGRKICGTPPEDLSSSATHAFVGADIMRGCTSALLELAMSIALTHHERWDGTGYPLGLAGESIPQEGRITAVADVFDALSNRRPYKQAIPIPKCFEILEECRGTHFDPRVLDAFFARKDDIVAMHIQYADV